MAALTVPGSGQGVQVGVGRGVGALAGDAEYRAGRSRQEEEVDAAARERLVQ